MSTVQKRMAELVRIEHYEDLNYSVELNIETLIKAKEYFIGQREVESSKKVASGADMNLAEIQYKFVRESKKLEFMNDGHSATKALSMAETTNVFNHSKKKWVEEMAKYEQAKGNCENLKLRIDSIAQMISILKEEFKDAKFIKDNRETSD
jgi:hypothetical protein